MENTDRLSLQTKWQACLPPFQKIQVPQIWGSFLRVYLTVCLSVTWLCSCYSKGTEAWGNGTCADTLLSVILCLSSLIQHSPIFYQCPWHCSRLSCSLANWVNTSQFLTPTLYLAYILLCITYIQHIHQCICKSEIN